MEEVGLSEARCMVLAIDGAYLHIVSSAKWVLGVFENGRTSSYHIEFVIAYRHSAKCSSTFKLVVHKGGGKKEYDFEAENPKTVNEIVQNVRSITTAAKAPTS